MKRFNKLFVTASLLFTCISCGTVTSSDASSSSIGESSLSEEITSSVAKQKYSVAVESSIEGAGVLTGEGVYEENSDVTISVSENEGYFFVGWYDENDELYSSEKTTIVENVTTSRVITAKFGTLVEGGYIFEGVIYQDNETYLSVSDYNEEVKSNVKILPSILGKPVTTIENRAFNECEIMTSIDIPNSITSIGNKGFSWCINLKNIDIPDSVTTLGTEVFYNCTLLERVTMSNNVTILSQGLFTDCDSLKNFVVPTSVTIIGYSAFTGCSGMVSVTIPNSVTKIEPYAFSYCLSLESVEIPNSVKKIDKSVFYDCDSLKTVVLPNTIKTIGYSAFGGCDSLENINIPNSVTTIGLYSFMYCKSLRSIVIPISVETINEGAFSSLDDLTIYCEAETKPEGWDEAWADTYGVEKYWANQWSYVDGIPTPNK